MRLLSNILKVLKPAPPKPAPPKVAGLFAPPYGPAAGWWRDDHVEQLRKYTSWVYAAVNAIAQEAARQRPYLYRDTGPAEHDQEPLPTAHPLARLSAGGEGNPLDPDHLEPAGQAPSAGDRDSVISTAGAAPGRCTDSSEPALLGVAAGDGPASGPASAAKPDGLAAGAVDAAGGAWPSASKTITSARRSMAKLASSSARVFSSRGMWRKLQRCNFSSSSWAS